MTQQIAIDYDAEEAVLAILLLYPQRYDDVAASIKGTDFAVIKHQDLFEAIARSVTQHGTVDLAALSAHECDADLARRLFYETAPAVGLLGRHVERVASAAANRRIIHLLSVAGAELQNVDVDPRKVVNELTVEAEAAYPMASTVDGYTDYDEWAARATMAPKHWVIPGVIRRQGRMMIVGAEGGGKSALLRQIGICAAAGYHPFKGTLINPIRVLCVDLENDPETGMDEHGTIDIASPYGLVLTVARMVPDRDPMMIRVWARPDGIDLRNSRDVGYLERVIQNHKPDLVTLGPIYKAYARAKGEDDEVVGAQLQQVLDRLRLKYDCAFIFEHHAPHGQGARDFRPFGTSLWRRWPDVGIALTPCEGQEDRQRPDLLLKRFRGDRYSVDQVPPKIIPGATLPWIAVKG